MQSSLNAEAARLAGVSIPTVRLTAHELGFTLDITGPQQYNLQQQQANRRR